MCGFAHKSSLNCSYSHSRPMYHIIWIFMMMIISPSQKCCEYNVAEPEKGTSLGVTKLLASATQGHHSWFTIHTCSLLTSINQSINMYFRIFHLRLFTWTREWCDDIRLEDKWTYRSYKMFGPSSDLSLGSVMLYLIRLTSVNVRPWNWLSFKSP